MALKKDLVNSQPFRVLTIDGGGMRGLYTATLLRVLAERFDAKFRTQDADFGKSFDLICGTSTGAILACALAAGVPLSEVAGLYQKHGPSIFPRPVPKMGRFKTMWWMFSHRNRPAAEPEALRTALESRFRDMTLGEVYQKRGIAVCIAAVNANTHRACVLKTPHFQSKHRDDNVKLSEACLASSAAPILFPLFQNDRIPFVDGGLWANNPVLVGMIEALLLTPKDQPVHVVSVGTCDQPNGDPRLTRNPNWGLLRWRAGVRSMEMSLAAQASGHDQMARFLQQCFEKQGRPIKVLRLQQTPKSPEQFSAIGLDRADDLALETLRSMARTDADQIHSDCMRADCASDMQPLINAFRDLSPLPPSTANSAVPDGNTQTQQGR